MNQIDTGPFSLPLDDLKSVFESVGSAWKSFQNKHVFITGGTGFVGKWLLGTLLYANEHLALDCHITILSRNPESFIESYPQLKTYINIEFIKGNVDDFIFPNKKIDYIVHAATDVINPGGELDVFQTCVNGTWRVLELAKQSPIESFLFLSSGAVYGRQCPNEYGMSEEITTAPRTTEIRSAYGEGKRAGEWLVFAYSSQHLLPVKVARCFAFSGPHLSTSSHFAIGNFVRDAINGSKIVIQGDGTPYRSYLYAADMVIWLWKLLLNGQNGHAYNVGGQFAYSISELAWEVIDALDSAAIVEIKMEKKLHNIAERYVPNTEKIRHQFGLCETVSLKEGIKKYADWCERNLK